MARPDYKSIEANGAPMNTLSTDEAESASLLPVEAQNASDTRLRGNRNRLISLVSVVLAIVGVSLLVSFSNGSNSKTTSAKVVADMHTFESISSGINWTGR